MLFARSHARTLAVACGFVLLTDAGVAQEPTVTVHERVIRPAFVENPECESPGWGSQYDMYYALSTDHGQTFVTHNLRTNCDAKSALDLALQGDGIPTAFGPREYNGIGLYETAGSTRLWTLYTGTSSEDVQDDPDHRSVIFGQQIVFTQGS